MVDHAKALKASKSAATLLVLFIPSRDRDERPIDQQKWVDEGLKILGELFGGATAYPLGTETGQGAVGLVVDDRYLEIRFPLKD